MKVEHNSKIPYICLVMTDPEIDNLYGIYPGEREYRDAQGGRCGCLICMASACLMIYLIYLIFS